MESTFQSPLTKPSILDYLAQEALEDLFRPATQRLLDYLAHRNEFFLWVKKRFDEIFYFGAILPLQYYHLKKFNATFFEYFYGLQRTNINNPRSFSLSKENLTLSLIAVVLWPYLKTKLNDFSERMRLEVDFQTHNNKDLALRKFIIQCNSFLNIIFILLKTYQYIKYLSEKTDIISPLHWFAGVKLTYADARPIDEYGFTLKNLIRSILPSNLLGLGAFLIQFNLLWQTENRHNKSNNVPVPLPSKQVSQKVIQNILKCHHTGNYSKAVVAESGYMFCLECIAKFLMENGHCPVTKLPASINNLIRIYPSS